LYLTTQKLYLFEVKNFEGDYHLDQEKWLTSVKKEVKNPLLQLNRNETLFRILLQEHLFQFPVEAILVFINPHFHLYQASSSHPVVFHSQLNRFSKTLKSNCDGPLKAFHSKLAEKLLALHLEKSPFERLPEYEYDLVGKGVVCRSCHSLYSSLQRSYFTCGKCQLREAYLPAVLRNIEEFRLLFPDRKITTEQIHDWCGIIQSKKTIRKILNEHYDRVGYGKFSHYVSKRV
jgi:hypothetical protein